MSSMIPANPRYLGQPQTVMAGEIPERIGYPQGASWVRHLTQRYATATFRRASMPASAMPQTACQTPQKPATTAMRNSRHYYRARRLARFLSGGNDDVGREVASLRNVPELLGQLGQWHEVHYGPPVSPGTAPEVLKVLAEGLVPGQYGPGGE